MTDAAAGGRLQPCRYDPDRYHHGDAEQKPWGEMCSTGVGSGLTVTCLSLENASCFAGASCVASTTDQAPEVPTLRAALDGRMRGMGCRAVSARFRPKAPLVQTGSGNPATAAA